MNWLNCISKAKIFFVLSGLILLPSPSSAAGPYDQLRGQDGRLAGISETLLASNTPLCREQMALPGFVLHSRDQYGEAVGESLFFNGSDVAIAAVVPGSLADAAGIRPDDGVVSIDGLTVSEWPELPEMPRRDGAIELLGDVVQKADFHVVVERGEDSFDLDLPVRSGCKALVEILAEDGVKARADGRVIQVSLGLALEATDEGLAVILAHELAHDILEHRKRLEAAGVSKGLFAEFGRNRRLNRQAEVEADRLSVHLLANAGFDPSLAPTFWRSELGKDIGGGLFRSRIYPSPEGRAEIMDTEIATYLAGSGRPSNAAHLVSLRDEPMD